MQAFAGLQAKLIAAFVLLVVVSLWLSGVVFVRLQQDSERQQALDHAAVETGPIYATFLLNQFQGATIDTLVDYTRETARTRSIRMLIIDRSRAVVADTAGRLTGQELQLVPAGVTFASGQRPFSAFNVRGGGDDGLLLLGPARELLGETTPEARTDASAGADVRGTPLAESGTPGAGGTVAPSARQGGGRSSGGADPGSTAGGASATGGPRTSATRGPGFRPTYQLVFAVRSGDLTQAWLGLLPGLALAGGIALPVAVVLAILLARYITGPLRGLTAATAAVAAGRFDVNVPATRRRDEVGHLAAAFTSMTERVGESQAQVRALIADVSHNLKTPLTPILGFSRALANGDAEPGDVRRMGAVIHEEAERLAARLQDLLYLGELESGQAVFQREPADLSALVQAAVPRLLTGLDERGIHLVRDIAPNVVVDADVPSLERAVENLLDNLQKYTPPGGAASVRLHESDGVAVLEVSNTAPGLESDELPRLFERFYRSRSASVPGRTRPHGSGLGLPIARDIVELHAGTLSAVLDPPALTFSLRLALSTA